MYIYIFFFFASSCLLYPHSLAIELREKLHVRKKSRAVDGVDDFNACSYEYVRNFYDFYDYSSLSRLVTSHWWINKCHRIHDERTKTFRTKFVRKRGENVRFVVCTLENMRTRGVCTMAQKTRWQFIRLFFHNVTVYFLYLKYRLNVIEK